MKHQIARIPPRSAARAVYGQSLAAARPTLWVPFLIATALSLPVALISLIVALLP